VEQAEHVPKIKQNIKILNTVFIVTIY
jgi:hypothetical protein